MSERKVTYKRCKSTSYLQSTLSECQNQAITMTDLQWLSSKVNMLCHIPRESSRVAWYFLRHGGDITCEITGRKCRVTFDIHFLEEYWTGKATAVARVLKMPLVEAVVSISQNSTYWLLWSQDCHKRLLKMPCSGRWCSFPG